ncbi:hypothetical protein [Rodentibacter pneumotropicus]|uniref:hypothetical protein n=1 Tax=Rodentibacter pneumotropicus TaxID=758 RepID=UPI001F611551|nr:hypothetical protein [Rodentibacter pneumotropicus]
MITTVFRLPSNKAQQKKQANIQPNQQEKINMATMFTYNEEQAVKGGQSNFISETGAYIGKIIAAKYTKSQGGAQAIEFSIETDDGQLGNYLSVYYKAKDGNDLASGVNMIQAIMGVTGVTELTVKRQGDDDIAPELTNRRIGLFLQKELITKNDGSDSYRLQITCPFSPASRKTLAEHLNGEEPKRIQWLLEHTQDKDSRAKNSPSQEQYQAQHQYYQSTTPAPQNNSGFDDGIPF